MRRLLILLALVAMISCKKSSEKIDGSRLNNANYKGTFQRISGGADNMPALS